MSIRILNITSMNIDKYIKLCESANKQLENETNLKILKEMTDIICNKKTDPIDKELAISTLIDVLFE